MFEKELEEFGRRAGELDMQGFRDWAEMQHFRRFGQILDLDHPETCNEKIQWLKLFGATPEKTRLADKYAVREFVRERIGEKYLVPLLGVYGRFGDIDLASLPRRFVLKCTHGCKYNVIVKDKTELDVAGTRAMVDGWMTVNYAFVGSPELQYRDIPPRIVAEQYLENAGGDLYDYKFWCFEGKVGYIQFLSERNLGGLKMAFYDREWNKQPFVYDYPLDEKTIPRPDNLDLMIELAERLSAGFCCVRVDFYRLDDGSVYFGEMTFSPRGGNLMWNDPTVDHRLGALFDLPKQAYDPIAKMNFDHLSTRPNLKVIKAGFEKAARIRRRLEATSAKLEATRTRLEATRTKLEASRTKLEASRTKLEATRTKLEATRTKLEASRKRNRKLKASAAYRLGMLLTWPMRKARSLLK